MVRDARRCRAPHHEGLRPHPEKCEAIHLVSRTRCSVLHDAPQSRDPKRCGGHNGPRISSAPLRAAQHPGHAFLILRSGLLAASRRMKPPHWKMPSCVAHSPHALGYSPNGRGAACSLRRRSNLTSGCPRGGIRRDGSLANGSLAAVEGPGAALLVRERRNGRIAALLATTTLVAVAALLPGVARAQNATWLAVPADNIFNNNNNWNPATVPTGTASFDTSSITSLTFSAPFTVIGGWTFNPGASAYSFTIGALNTVNLAGAGIVINGGSASIQRQHHQQRDPALLGHQHGRQRQHYQQQLGNPGILQHQHGRQRQHHQPRDPELLRHQHASARPWTSTTPARPAAPPSPTTAAWASSTPARLAAPPSPTTSARP